MPGTLVTVYEVRALPDGTQRARTDDGWITYFKEAAGGTHYNLRRLVESRGGGGSRLSHSLESFYSHEGEVDGVGWAAVGVG